MSHNNISSSDGISKQASFDAIASAENIVFASSTNSLPRPLSTAFRMKRRTGQRPPPRCRELCLERPTVFGDAVDCRERLVPALHALDHGNRRPLAHTAPAPIWNATRGWDETRPT